MLGMYYKEILVITILRLSCVVLACDPCNNERLWATWSEYDTCSPLNGNQCDKYQTRTRKYNDIFACQDCALKKQTKKCEVCSQECNRETGCFCNPGYQLASGSVNICEDINECSTNNGNCKHTCSNNNGSFECSCKDGYQKTDNIATSPNCDRQQCGALTPTCPLNSYKDLAGNSCENVRKMCTIGSLFESVCTFSCPSDNYELAFIDNASGPKMFSEHIKDADFNVTTKSATCGLDTSDKVSWNISSTAYENLYCRRINDAPRNLKLSSNLVEEHMPANTIVGVVTASDDANQKITFTTENSEGINDFYLNGTTLKTLRPIDLKNLQKNTISLKIRATDDHPTTPFYAEQLFVIEIQNVNDPPVEIILSKTSLTDLYKVGDVVGNLTAIDYDDVPVKRSTNFEWSLPKTDNGYFAVSGHAIILAKKLDKNQDFTFSITVRCTDYDQDDPKYSEKNIFLFIANVNNPVEMNLTVITSPLLESLTDGTVYGQLHIVDKENDTITINNLSSNETKSTFTIKNQVCRYASEGNMCTADIVLSASLDYERKQNYTLVVQAIDSHSEQMIKSFDIRIVNVNEPPSLLVISPTSLIEGSSKDVLVATLQVVDKDSFLTTCQVIDDDGDDDDDKKIFEIRSKNVVLKENGLINFEERNEYTLKVRCVDDGKPPLEIINETRIYVEDKNEVPGSPCQSPVTIKHSKEAGYEVLKLSSDDPDNVKEIKQALMYTLINGADVPFEIKNGALVVNSNMNAGATYDVNIMVKDDGVVQEFLDGQLVASQEDAIQETYVCKIKTEDAIICPKNREVKEGVCVCTTGLYGAMCDRNRTKCASQPCISGDTCSQFIESSVKCVSSKFQLPMLLNIPFDNLFNEKYRQDLETYVKDVLEGNSAGKSLKNFESRRKRRSPTSKNELYIESVNLQKVESIYTYITFLPFNASNSMSLVDAASLCALLQNTDLKCVDKSDCQILKNNNIRCVHTFGEIVAKPTTDDDNDSDSDGDEFPNYVYIVIGIFGVLILTLIVIFFVKRSRSRKKSRESDKPVFYNNQTIHVNPGSDPNQSMQDIQDLRRVTNIQNFDSSVFQNENNPNEFDFANPAYGLSKKSGTKVNYRENHAFVEDKKPDNDNDNGKLSTSPDEHVYASIGKAASNPLYQPSLKRPNSKLDVVDITSEKNVKGKELANEEKEPNLGDIKRGASLNEYNPEKDEGKDKTVKKDMFDTRQENPYH